MLKSTLAAVAAVFALSAVSPAALAAKGDPHVLLTTSAGNIELELNSQKAPVSVKNFLDYVNSGFYNNTTFHRVIPGFMVQGGGCNEQMQNAFRDYFDGTIDIDAAKKNFETAIMELYPELTEVVWPE